MTVQDRIDTVVPSPRTAPEHSDLAARVRAAVADVPGIDTRLVHFAVEGADVLLVGRVQWRSEAAAVGRRVGWVAGVGRLRNRIGFHYDDVGDRLGRSG